MTTVLVPQQANMGPTTTGLIMRAAPLTQLPKACPSHLCRFVTAPVR
jgi:hypothetical protein